MFIVVIVVIFVVLAIIAILLESNRKNDGMNTTTNQIVNEKQATNPSIENDTYINNDGMEIPKDIEMLVVTTENIKGHDYEVIGECFGLTTQSKDVFSNIGASFKNVVGGEIKTYTKMLQASRMEAIRRMKQDAKSKGADAIVMMRFDTDSMVEGVQTVVAYGTAVKLKNDTSSKE